MRDKITKWQISTGQSIIDSKEPPVSENFSNEAIDALVSLGYKPAEASKMINKLDHEGKNSEELIKLALKNSLSG